MQQEAPAGVLWTRDFTIITVGTVVSMLGNAVSSFAAGLLVLDYTESTLLYALFMGFFTLPQILVPLLAGPFLDRFSRKRVIYTLDFCSSALYALVAAALFLGFFNYPVYLLFSFTVGAIQSLYNVAYESFYPTLITPGNFTRAYSVSSLIYPLATTVMVPVAGLCYRTVGLAPLFVFNALAFFTAASFETRIRAPEPHLLARRTEVRFDRLRYRRDFREGLSYLRSEPGLVRITAFFFFMMMAGTFMTTLYLPYFRSAPGHSVEQYTIIMAVSTLGRLVGGTIHYRFRYPTGKKFGIAVFVYIAISILDGGYLFTPYLVMLLLQFFSGILGVTSYNIRISGTQSYVPDDRRGRFNGAFNMITMTGNIIGQLLAGALGSAFPIPVLVACAGGFILLCVFAVFLPGRAAVRSIYNQNA